MVVSYWRIHTCTHNCTKLVEVYENQGKKTQEISIIESSLTTKSGVTLNHFIEVDGCFLNSQLGSLLNKDEHVVSEVTSTFLPVSGGWLDIRIAATYKQNHATQIIANNLLDIIQTTHMIYIVFKLCIPLRHFHYWLELLDL